MTSHQVPNFDFFSHSELERPPTPDRHQSNFLPSSTAAISLKTSSFSYTSKIPRLITPFDAEKYKPSYARQTRSTALKRKGYTYRPQPKRLALHSKLPLSQEARIRLQEPPKLKLVWRHKLRWYI
ncbi:MAG TPA: hypothetical protein VGO47_08515 [Chlamydiales bacterium]|nr:hypothetical protein [Chlamydiales bacterium]